MSRESARDWKLRHSMGHNFVRGCEWWLLAAEWAVSVPTVLIINGNLGVAPHLNLPDFPVLLVGSQQALEGGQISSRW
jgi:hypothetical protein